MQDTPTSEQRRDPANVQTVLVVEDDADVGEALTAFLEDETTYQVIYVPDVLNVNYLGPPVATISAGL